jgi:dTDP-4-amino-4,6-dideoxygalactose transaminase
MGADVIRISSPVLGTNELAAVRRVIRSGNLVQGAEVAGLEEEFAAALGVRHAVAVANGTVALELAIRALGIGPGDEVITSPFTFFASVSSIIRAGATPVLADIDAGSFNIDPAAVEAAVTPRTAAIMPVHLYGRPADMAALGRIARRLKLAIVEDACQAVGARHAGRSAGSFGLGCFSFYGSKNITSGEGGMVTTRDRRIAERMRSLRSQGSSRTYEHTEVSGNYRMTDMQAALLRAQLERLDWITSRRQANAGAYDRWIRNRDVVHPPHNDDTFESCFHQYTIRVPRRSRSSLQASLLDAGIESRVYYPRPVHQQPAWPRPIASYPHSERAAREVLSIPVHPGLRKADVRAVSNAINAGP